VLGYGDKAVEEPAKAALGYADRAVGQGVLAAGAPVGAAGAMSPVVRKQLWCRIQAGVPEVLEQQAVSDLSRDEEVARALDRYWLRYRGELKRRIVRETLERQGVTVLRVDVPVEELESLAKPGTVREPVRSDLLTIPVVRQHVDEINKLFNDYDRLVQSEYAGIDKAAIRREFEGLAAKRGILPWQYYRWLRKFYFRRGITDPLARIEQIVPDVHFLGRRVGGAHPDLIAILARAERALHAMGVKDLVAGSITTAYSFVPRPKNNLVGLSPHALGRAIDINAARNPHVVGRSATAIDAILAWLEGRGLAKPWRMKSTFEPVDFSTTPEHEAQILVQKMKDISDSLRHFLDTYLDDWLAETSTGKPGEVEAVPLLEEFLVANGALTQRSPRKINQRRLAEIQRIRQVGLITMPLELFTAMKMAGAHLGLEFTTSKDTMHFEAKPAIPGGPPPPCTRRRPRKRAGRG
jgi:hypothetical protein